MLPTTLVTIISVLLELSCSSPVYNMQPAYITATIGSTGRNIRNLPCISRKSSESGVCMFAIDCLKANGTHLGTCIDRFYFGSCCHIAPAAHDDITENTIDTALIPSRQPPNRIPTTTTIAAATESTFSTENVATTTSRPGGGDVTTTMGSTVEEILTKLTTLAKVTPTTPVSAVITKKPLVTTTFTKKPSLSTTVTKKPLVSTVVTKKPLISTVITKKPLVETTTKTPVDDDDEVPYKISTFQSVDGNEVTTTLKPFPTTTTAPRPTKPVKPVTVAKPVKPVLTHKPKPSHKPNVTVIYRPTHKPASTKRPRPTTQKPVKLTKPAFNVTKVATKPTRAPTTNASKIPTTEFVVSSKKPPQTTTPPKTTMMTKVTSFVVTKADTTTQMITEPTTTTTTTKIPFNDEEPTTVKNAAAITESNELSVNNANTSSSSVNGNPATNEIESGLPVIKPAPAVDVTTLPTLVTWSQVHDNATTTEAAGSSSSSSEEPEDWVPITTPDGWVLLPSLSTVTEPTSSESTLSGSSSSSSAAASNEASGTSQSSTESMDSTSVETIVSLSTTSEESSSSQMVSSSDVSNATTVANAITTEASFTSAKPVVNMTDYTDVCGRRMFPEARIVGGEKSSFGKWPWQISLRQWRTSTYLHKCGAALLNENWAITAAHCVDNVPPSDLLLRLGEHDLSTESEPYLHQERRVQIVASHPQFDARTFEYDLALLRFYEPVTFQPNIIPVCVPQNDENFVGRTAYVTGWGRLYEDGPLPSILQEVSVPVINNTVCESMYRSAGYIEHIPNIFICAGWRRGGFDSCEGDSGGPMVIQRPDKRFLLAGVISWGIGCAEPNQPGVYTRISEFRDWINQILQF